MKLEMALLEDCMENVPIEDLYLTQRACEYQKLIACDNPDYRVDFLMLFNCMTCVKLFRTILLYGIESCRRISRGFVSFCI